MTTWSDPSLQAGGWECHTKNVSFKKTYMDRYLKWNSSGYDGYNTERKNVSAMAWKSSNRRNTSKKGCTFE